MGMIILIEIYFLTQERGHDVTLVEKQCRLDIRKYSFSQRTINEWNKLSTDFMGRSVAVHLSPYLYTHRNFSKDNK